MLHIPVNEQGWGLFIQLIKNFAKSPSGGKAIGLFSVLVAFIIGANGLYILTSFVGRDFMTAIAVRDSSAFLWEALVYVGVFAVSTLVAVILRYSEESLALVWRDWMTREFVELYLKYPTYYRINDALLKSSGIEHPDQRISEDVKVFTTTTLSFTLMLLNGLFTVVAFSGVLWSISPWLFVAAVLYALLGSYLTIVLGRPLVDLNYDQLDKEASFRSGLMHVRERAESLALLHREKRMLARLHRRFDDLAQNFRKIILVNRKLNCFSSGYNYLVQIIPVMLVAPLFMQGKVEFGVITQSAAAFATLIGAFSLIITQFQSISSFAAVIQRLINLWYAIELAQTDTVSGMDVTEADGELAFQDLTLRSGSDGRILVRDLSVSIPQGTSVLVTGPDEMAKDSLFKATAGLSDTGTGRVKRPAMDDFLFLPERTYLPPGTLREALAPVETEKPVTDELIHATLADLGVEAVISRAGGLDVEQDWDNVLSVGEQQLLSFARILLAEPHFVFLNCPGTDLGPEKTAKMLKMLADRKITYLTIGRYGQNHIEERPKDYDAVLDIKPEGRWEWKPLHGGAGEGMCREPVPLPAG